MSLEDFELPTEDQLAKFSPGKRAGYDAALQQLRDTVVKYDRAREAKKVRQVQAGLQAGYDAAVGSLPDCKLALKEAEDDIPRGVWSALYPVFMKSSTQQFLQVTQALRKYIAAVADLRKLLLEIETALDQFTRMSFAESQDPQFVEKLASLLRQDLQSRLRGLKERAASIVRA